MISNKKYFAILGTFIINLQEYIKYSRIIVIHSDFNEHDIDILQKIEKNLIFIQYNIEDFLKDFNFQDNIIESYFIKRFTHLTLAKYKLFEFLDQYKQVMYCDCDMMFYSNIDDLLQKNSYNIIGAVNTESIFNRVQTYFKKHQQSGEIIYNNEKICQIYRNTLTYNGGFFILNDNFDYINAFQCAHEYIKIYFPIHPSLFDESLFGYIIHVCNLHVYNIDRIVNMALPDDVNAKTQLVHFYASHKPWSNILTGNCYSNWFVYYDKFIRLSGITREYIIVNQGHFYSKNRSQLIENIDFFSKVIIQLVKLLPDMISYDYNIKRHYFQFYISDLPHQIHYELLRKNNKLYFCIHCENKLLKQYVEENFKNISKKLSVTVDNICFIEKELPIDEDLINNIMKYIYITLPDVQKIKIDSISSSI